MTQARRMVLVRHPRRAGTTLAEVIVFSVLMSMLSTAVVAVYILSMRYMLMVSKSVELEQSAQRAMTFLMNDIADSTPRGVNPMPNGIFFLTPRDSMGNFVSGPTWQAWICYYIDGNQNLVRKRIGITPTANFNQISQPTWSTTSDLAALNAPSQLIAENETDLSFSYIAQGGVQLATFSGSFGTNIFSIASNPGNYECKIIISGYKVRPRN